MPKFVTAPAYPDLRLVGAAGGPAVNPVARMTITPQAAAYETLFSFLDTRNQPMAAAYPGSWGPYLMMAGRR